MTCCICGVKISETAINIIPESKVESTYCEECGEEMISNYTNRKINFDVEFEAVQDESGEDIDHQYECYRDEQNGY